MRTAGLGIVFGFALLLIVGVYLANTLAIMERVAMVDRVVGSPQLLVHGKGAPGRVQQGKLVRAGDIIQTGPKDSVDLRWARWVGGMRIRVGPNSRFLIRKATVNRSTTEENSYLRLDAGTIWVRLRDALRARSKFEVETPTVVAAVRGTVFRVTVDEQGASRVEVYEGKVEVRGAGGGKATLVGGSEALLARGQRSARGEPLSPAQAREWRMQAGIIGPLLEVTAPGPAANVGPECAVKGRVEPGARLVVDGERIAADQARGTFSRVLRLPRGRHTVSLRAEDGRGGVTEVTRTVTVQ